VSSCGGDDVGDRGNIGGSPALSRSAAEFFSAPNRIRKRGDQETAPLVDNLTTRLSLCVDFRSFHGQVDQS